MKRSLSQSQAAEVLRAASSLPPVAHAMFLNEVHDRLRSIPRQPLTDGDVQGAIISTLSGINIVPCDPAEGA